MCLPRSAIGALTCGMPLVGVHLPHIGTRQSGRAMTEVSHLALSGKGDRRWVAAGDQVANARAVHNSLEPAASVGAEEAALFFPPLEIGARLLGRRGLG